MDALGRFPTTRDGSTGGGRPANKDGPPLPSPLPPPKGGEGEIEAAFSVSFVNSTAVEGQGGLGRVREIMTLEGHADAVLSIEFSSDGKLIATASADGTARVWDTATGRLLQTLEGHRDYVRSVAFSHDGTRIVTASDDNTAKVWETSSGRILLTLRGLNDWVLSARFSPDGAFVAAAGYEGIVKLWNATDGRELTAARLHDVPIQCASFSPDGKRLITGARDNVARIWKLGSNLDSVIFRGHQATVRSVAFSRDGRLMVTSGEDGTARIWDVTSKRELRVFNPNDGPVTTAAFSPDGLRVAAVGADGLVSVWDAASSAQLAIWEQDEQSALARVTRRAGEQRESVRQLRAAQARDPGAIRQWLILLPIPLSGIEGVRALEAELCPGESQLRPRSDDRTPFGAVELSWQPFQLDSPVIDFHSVLGHSIENCAAYAVCYIDAEADQSGLRLLVGSDDQSKIYLNGHKVFQSRFKRGFTEDEDVVEGLRLNAGKKIFVFKVINMTAHWAGSVRLTDAGGQPVKGIKVSLTP